MNDMLVEIPPQSGLGWRRVSWEEVFSEVHRITPWLAAEINEPKYFWPSRVEKIAEQKAILLDWQWVLGFEKPDVAFSTYLWEQEVLIDFFLAQVKPVETFMIVLDFPPNLKERMAISVDYQGDWEHFYNEFPYQIFGASQDIFLIFPEIDTILAVHHGGMFCRLEKP
nr:hypothetical protein [Armatimonas sp.]